MNNQVSFSDRIISVLTYFTIGFFGLIWIIWANIRKIRISKFTLFNIYQAIFISIILAIFSLLYDISISFLSALPFVGNLFKSFHIFFTQTPIYFTNTISGLIITIFIGYLILMSILGLKPKVPLISNVIESNFGV